MMKHEEPKIVDGWSVSVAGCAANTPPLDSLVCSVCGHVSQSDEEKESHYKIHPPKKMFQCDMCPYMASRVSNLKTHKRVHTGLIASQLACWSSWAST